MSKPVKEFYPSELTEGQTHFVVRLGHYGSQLSYFLGLFEEVKRDFPYLAPEDVKVVHYGSDHIPGYFGLEFTLNVSETPTGYRQISLSEFTR